MKKKIIGVPFYAWLIVWAIAIVGIVFGSIYDLKISIAIADYNNWFAKFIEGFGELGGYAIAPIGATLIFKSLYKDRPTWAKVIGWAVLVLGIAVTGYIFGKALTSKWSFDIPKVVCYILGFVIMGGISAVTYFFLGNVDRGTVLRIGILLVAVMVAQLIIMTGLKYLAGRPRFRSNLARGDYSAYKNWWEWNWMKGGKPSEDFRSFPSGHTATSSLLLFLCIIPTLNKGASEKLALPLFFVGIAYSLIVAFGRIVMGAHFLADVSTGLLVGSLVAFVGSFIAEHVKKPSEEAVAE